MRQPSTVSWMFRCWFAMAMICSWLKWFCCMMTFLKDIFVLCSNVFNPASGHIPSTEVRSGIWQDDMSIMQRYEEYLSPDEISKYLDENYQLVEWRIPKENAPERRQLLGSSWARRYRKIIWNASTVCLRRKSQAEVPSASTSAEVGRWYSSKHSDSIVKLCTSRGLPCGCWDKYTE